MAIVNVQLGVTAIKELLDNGYTWLKKDDLGFGSVQEKFQASDVQISAIRKHPLLKDLETTARIFVIIDDTKDKATTEIKKAEPVETISTSEQAVLPMADLRKELVSNDADSFSAFANL